MCHVPTSDQLPWKLFGCQGPLTAHVLLDGLSNSQAEISSLFHEILSSMDQRLVEKKVRMVSLGVIEGVV